MSLIDAIIQGIIQGLTEFLPVSSSGHLGLYQHLTGIVGENASIMTITLHIGTLAAVILAFYKKIGALIKEFFVMVKDIFTGKFKWRTMNQNRRMIWMIVISILPLFVFFVFRHYFTAVGQDNDIIAEAICFLYTSAILTIGSRCTRKYEASGRALKTARNLTVVDALIIGFFQGVALLPGVSRSGSTISGAQICGMKREDSVEYSFILGIPVILAGALTEFSDLGASDTTVEILPLVVGALVAAVAGYFAIMLINWLMKSDRFQIFAVYTLIIGILALIAGIYEHATGTLIADLI
ncbi:MAG: undecaprenyl-diphosphate phosphatase [Oscillospiraceae bacterium]|nr:undecaprenyl-diphosphate phosphatase [Oscillospiraceae bacterium]